MPNELFFRRLGPHEAQDYRRLRLECLKEFPENFMTVYEEQVLLPKLFMELEIEKESNSNFIIGAFSGQQLIGQVAINCEENPRMKHVAHVLQMYVKPKYSGQKIGLNMLNFAIVSAWKVEGLEQLRLEVVTTSFSAIKVYVQAGFKEIGLYKQQMKIGDRYKDAMAMVRFKTEMAS